MTELLRAWRKGDHASRDRLLEIVQAELHQMAQRIMRREAPGHTWQTTELVHEAYLRLVKQTPQVEWRDRTHFFAVASQVMRHLLVDHARARLMEKRGGGAERVSLEDVALVTPEPSADLIALDDALDRLAVFDPQKSRIVEMRYFGGLTVEEIADVLGIAAITVKREWARAKAWLYREMQPEPAP